MTKMNLDKSGGPKASLPPPEEKRAIESAGSPPAFFDQSVWGADAGTADADDSPITMSGIGNSRANRKGEAPGNDASTGAQGVPPGSHPVSKTDNPTSTGAGEGNVKIRKVSGGTTDSSATSALRGGS